MNINDILKIIIGCSSKNAVTYLKKKNINYGIYKNKCSNYDNPQTFNENSYICCLAINNLIVDAKLVKSNRSG
jgi:hypothetical protein